MTKHEFLTGLESRLCGLPEADVRERVAFFSEMIDDRTEDGMSEEAAVEEVGPLDKVVDQILRETPLRTIVRERVRPKRVLRGWEIALIIIGSPIWAPVLLAVIAVAFAFYAVMWAVALALWACDLALAVAALAGIGGLLLFVTNGQPATALVVLGAGLICAALSIPLFFGCMGLVRALVSLARAFWLGLKKLFAERK